MGIYTGSFRELTNATPADVSLVDAVGNQITSLAGNPPTTATLTTVAASATSVTVLAANANRKSVIIFNNSPKLLTLAFAATASTAAFTLQIGSFGTYEGQLAGYTGIISGIWPTATGNAQVTEITP